MSVTTWVTPSQLSQFASGSLVIRTRFALQQALQPGARNLEPPSRFGSVTRRLVEHGVGGGLLDLGERGGKGQGTAGAWRSAQAQRGERERSGRGEQDGALDRVTQFANVAGPGMGEQGAPHLRRDGRLGQLVLRAELAEEELGEEEHVVAAVAQRRQLDG